VRLTIRRNVKAPKQIGSNAFNRNQYGHEAKIRAFRAHDNRLSGDIFDSFDPFSLRLSMSYHSGA